MQKDRAELNIFKFNVCMFEHIIKKFQFFLDFIYELTKMYTK